MSTITYFMKDTVEYITIHGGIMIENQTNAFLNIGIDSISSMCRR